MRNGQPIRHSLAEIQRRLVHHEVAEHRGRERDPHQRLPLFTTQDIGASQGDPAPDVA